jgi:site-specific recombinase XerD
MTEKIVPVDKNLAQLKEKMDDIAKSTKSDATKRAYRSDIQIFSQWCDSQGLECLPSTDEIVALYIVHLNEMKYKPSTIRRQLSAISQAHKLSGHDSPVTPHVKEIEKGIRRLVGTHQKKVEPITIEILKRILKHCGADIFGVRDRALFLIGFAGAFRRSEIISMDAEQLEHRAEGLVITMGKTKTDQEGEGRKVAIPFYDPDITLCPVRALTFWLKVTGIERGPVFRPLGQAKKIKEKRLRRRTIAIIVKKYIKLAGYDPQKFSGHSLRSGFATTAARKGIEERLIMRQTGHKSIPVMRGYIDDGTLFRNHPLAKVLS